MKNTRFIYFLGGLLLLAVLGFSLKVGFFKNSNVTTTQKGDKLQISASFYPLYYFSSQIGGNKADVQNITPAGSEPHDYDPSFQDIARIERGDILILNGGVEAWADKIRDNLRGTKVKIVIAGEDLLTKQLIEEGQTVKDPHVWLDPVLAKREVQKITEAYAAVDPANKTYYQDNERQLNSKLDQLDADYKKGLRNCQSRDVVTSHEAFAYLADRYGLNEVPIAGLSPDEEPSAQQLADVANFAKKNNVKYIFFESLVSPKLSETIASEIGAKTMVLDPIEGISDDDIKQGKNYFTVMKDNLKNLQTALQCST
ncbi:MAG: hypothetical protein A2857_06295 [Candidatus Levybacteria bacterium RIFCSPHIGHO2_01_FULL_36_15]|nr:MAG: hypothetical protein A2857_06295 [Candidatus Levybacteria bacterium RIFCSPHIGHO2_01_FULL_36_15]OGH38670.1 MAG: hypothetical protein A2905_02230 [Candidatus Levybacteria bacterium RIFCSPLOWO2_01_FULL_36_10]